MTTTVVTNPGAVATGYSNQRKVVKTSNGVIWAFFAPNGTTQKSGANCFYSADNGVTWNASAGAPNGSGVGTESYTRNFSVFIDAEDYCHVVFKDCSNGYIYYQRGTPNGLGTAWTWGTATLVYSNVALNYPDLVAHREGTGWKVHIVMAWLSGTTNPAYYMPLTISSTGTVTVGTMALVSTAGTYSVAVSTYPSIDFNHTGDGKTVKGGTPHLYVGWSAGKAGTGAGIRFRKATYSAGTWTWGTETEISSTYYVPNTYYSLNCMFDGTRVILVGEQGTSTTTKFLNLWERDAADTTTTTRVNGFSVISSNEVAQASCSYDAKGNVYWLGARTTSSHYPGVYWKWDRATNTLSSSYAVLTSALEDTAFFSAMRGYMGYSIPYVYTEGVANPYNVKYGTITLNQPPTSPTNVVASGTPVAGKTKANVTWTHNDPDSDPQTKYKIRWRKV